MSKHFLNKVQIIGNVTADPVIRQIDGRDPLCTFSLATNRYWKVDGIEKSEVQYHRFVAWSKLGEICAQLLSKGRKVYAEGRLASNKFTDKNGVERETIEIILEDMILLDSKPKDTTDITPKPTEDKPF